VAKFTESAVEDAALLWLQELEYAVAHGPERAQFEIFNLQFSIFNSHVALVAAVPRCVLVWPSCNRQQNSEGKSKPHRIRVASAASRACLRVKDRNEKNSQLSWTVKTR
jgi:hypothetical protein